MKSLLSLTCAITAVLALTSSGPLEAAGKSRAAVAPAAVVTQAGVKSSLTPADRGALARAFVTKWGPYVQQVYGTDVGTWAKRMVGSFAHSDPINFQRSLQRSTYEGALAELGGIGNRRSDAKVIDTFAAANSLNPTLLGDDNLDLVYTPITPCRIVDTRNAGGPINGNSTRDFKAWGVSNYLAQGGSATDCGLFGESPSAAVLNVTAVTPVSAGYATVFPYAGVQPFTASVNYTVNGDVVNNSITTPLAAGVPLFDFTIYTYAQSDYVVDIVGYYDAPHATALDCVTEQAGNTDVAAGANFSLSLPACPVGYNTTGAGCNSQGPNEVMWERIGLFGGADSAFCRGTNVSASSTKVNGNRRCCRVPGR